jgi:hypothetical protein
MEDPERYLSEVGWASLFLELLFPDFVHLVFTIYYGLIVAEFISVRL